MEGLGPGFAPGLGLALALPDDEVEGEVGRQLLVELLHQRVAPQPLAPGLAARLG